MVCYEGQAWLSILPPQPASVLFGEYSSYALEKPEKGGLWDVERFSEDNFVVTFFGSSRNSLAVS